MGQFDNQFDNIPILFNKQLVSSSFKCGTYVNLDFHKGFGDTKMVLWLDFKLVDLHFKLWVNFLGGGGLWLHSICQPLSLSLQWASLWCDTRDQSPPFLLLTARRHGSILELLTLIAIIQ